MYKLYTMSQKHNTKLLSIFSPGHWQQKNFAVSQTRGRNHMVAYS